MNLECLFSGFLRSSQITIHKWQLLPLLNASLESLQSLQRVVGELFGSLDLEVDDGKFLSGICLTMSSSGKDSSHKITNDTLSNSRISNHKITNIPMFVEQDYQLLWNKYSSFKNVLASFLHKFHITKEFSASQNLKCKLVCLFMFGKLNSLFCCTNLSNIDCNLKPITYRL